MPSPRGVSAIGVTATMATAAPLASRPLTGGSICNGGISGYPVVIRGLVMTRKCPSQGRARGKPGAGLLPANPCPAGELLGMLSSQDGCRATWVGWLSHGGERRAYSQARKPLLELITSMPQIFLLYPLTPSKDLPCFRGANTLHSPCSEVSHPSGILAITLLAVTAWSSKRPALGSSFSHKRPTYDQPHLGTYQYTQSRLD